MVTFTVKDKELKAVLAKLKKSVSDFSVPLKVFGERMKNDMIKSAFDREADPATGRAWAPLSPLTQSLRVKPGKALRDTGRLLNAYMASPVTATRKQMKLAPRLVVYSAVHQYGFTRRSTGGRGLAIPLNRKGRKALLSRSRVPGAQIGFVKSIKIPARPFLGFSAAHQETLKKVLMKHLSVAS
jgi:phage gpG-like protein